MKLGKDWITEHLIDLEFKRYQVLGYLQGVKKQFEEARVYPSLSELIYHYHNLIQLKKRTEDFHQSIPKQLDGIDLERLKLNYSEKAELDEAIDEVQNIIQFSIPLFQEGVEDGKKLFHLVEQQLSIQPIGISPLSNQEGYLLFHIRSEKDIKAYYYRISVIENPEDKSRSLETRYITTYHSGLKTTYPNVKQELIREHPEIPNPSVYAIESSLAFPWEETLLPIAKRIFLSKMAA